MPEDPEELDTRVTNKSLIDPEVAITKLAHRESIADHFDINIRVIEVWCILFLNNHRDNNNFRSWYYKKSSNTGNDRKPIRLIKVATNASVY